MKKSFSHTLALCSAGLFMGTTLMLTACNNTPTTKTPGGMSNTPPATTPPATTPPANVTKAPPAVTPSNLPTIRIDAGADADVTDAAGVKWSADTDFDGGESIARPDLQVTGTKTPEIYQTEHYSMNSYSVKVPNGKYVLSLHFSEGYDGIASAEDREFTYTVKDGTPDAGKTIKEVKTFSPWKAAGAQFKAYVDTIPVTVTNGAISVVFTPEVENPQINALEIVPQ